MPHHKKDYNSYDTYVYRVRDQVCPHNGMSKRAMMVLCSMVCDLERELSASASRLCEDVKSKTLSAREIQTAVRLEFPGELAKHAVSEGTKAVTRAVSTPAAKGKPRQDSAGIVFPIARIERHLHNRCAQRISRGAPTYLAAVLEYVVAEVLELSANAARDHRRHRITPRDIVLAIRNDEELHKLFRNATIPDAGVLPNLHYALLPARHH